MKKVRISAIPVMQAGGYPALSQEQRDKWELMQSDAYRQGFYGDNHSRQPGIDFMKSHGIDPAMLPAYQQDLLNQRNVDPWRRGSASNAYRGYSPVDNFYGDKTSRERYVQYAIRHGNEPEKNFGSNWQAATEYNNNRIAAESANWANFGNPKADINYRGVDAVYPENRPMAPVPQAQPTPGFPTRDQAIAKYKARQGKPLPSNYFDGNRYSGGDPIGNVRQTGQDVFKFGGMTSKKRVRISSIPQMGMGGGTYVPGGTGEFGEQQKGHGYALNRFWSSPAGYLGTTSQVQPFARIGNTLPEAQDGGDINAEKNERILGDFDQDGQQELMNVNGPSHAEGGKDVDVPSNSFVYSDTKDLKIKDPKVLAMFGITTKKRGGFTPADIAKKYDLNKYKPAMSDPNADEYSTKTAQLMTDKYLEKLSKLAHIQETMKHHMGMPNSANMARYGGAPPRYQYAGLGPFQDDSPVAGSVPGYPSAVFNNEEANDAVSDMVSPVYNMYSSTLTGEGYKRDRPNAANMQSFVQQSINPRPQLYGKPIIPNTAAGNAQYDMMRRAGWDGVEDPGKWAQRTQPEAVQSAIGASGMKNPAADAVSGNPLGDTYYGPRWQNFMPQGPDWNPTLENVVAGQPASVTAATPGAENYPVPTGSGHIPPGAEMIGKKREKGKGRRWEFGVDPNFYGNLQNVLQIASLRKFQPYEPAPQAVLPDTVFLDPTRAIAAQAEEARSGSEMDAMAGNPQAARAMAAMRQGIAGKQAADTIGQYHNQNVMIANQAGREAAAITNQLMEKQAQRLADLNKGNFLSDREYQKQMKNLQEEFTYRLQQQHNAQVNRLRYNKANPYFEMDRSGYYHLKPGVTEAKLQEIYNGKYSSGKKGLESYNALYQEAIKNGLDDKSARDYAWNESGLGQRRRVTYSSTDPSKQKITESDYESKAGGIVNRPLMKNGGPADLLKYSALKKFVK